MRRRKHWSWKWAKWTGIVLCMLTFVTWVLTAPIFMNRMYVVQYSDASSWVGIEWGVCHFSKYSKTNRLLQELIPFQGYWSFRVKPMLAWAHATNPSTYGIEFPSFSTTSGNGGFGMNVRVPLFLLFLVIAMSTSGLWYFDHCAQRGHCRKCDYDLTGNMSGICPECGAPISTMEKKASVSH